MCNANAANTVLHVFACSFPLFVYVVEFLVVGFCPPLAFDKSGLSLEQKSSWFLSLFLSLILAPECFPRLPFDFKPLYDSTRHFFLNGYHIKCQRIALKVFQGVSNIADKHLHRPYPTRPDQKISVIRRWGSDQTRPDNFFLSQEQRNACLEIS